MKFNELTLAMTYVGEEAGTWSLHALSRNEGVIHPDHLELSGWASALGGMRVLVDRIFCALDTTAGTDLFSHAWFLAETLAELQPTPALRALRAESGGDLVAQIWLEDTSRVALVRGTEGLELSYLDPSGGAPAERLSPYFDGLLVSTHHWVAAASVALEEWAEVTRRVAGPRPSGRDRSWRLLQALGF